MQDRPGQPPFERHKRYYIVLKVAVLAFAVILAAKLFNAV
jgi:hypothetical protein